MRNARQHGVLELVLVKSAQNWASTLDMVRSVCTSMHSITVCSHAQVLPGANKQPAFLKGQFPNILVQEMPIMHITAAGLCFDHRQSNSYKLRVQPAKEVLICSSWIFWQSPSPESHTFWTCCETFGDHFSGYIICFVSCLTVGFCGDIWSYFIPHTNNDLTEPMGVLCIHRILLYILLSKGY